MINRYIEGALTSSHSRRSRGAAWEGLKADVRHFVGPFVVVTEPGILVDSCAG